MKIRNSIIFPFRFEVKILVLDLECQKLQATRCFANVLVYKLIDFQSNSIPASPENTCFTNPRQYGKGLLLIVLILFPFIPSCYFQCLTVPKEKLWLTRHHLPPYFRLPSYIRLVSAVDEPYLVHQSVP